MRGGPEQASKAKLLSAGGCFVAKCRQVSGWPVCHQEKHCPSISHLILLMPEKQELLGSPNPAHQSLRSSDWLGLETTSQRRGSLFVGSLLTAGPGHAGLLPHPWEQDSHIPERKQTGFRRWGPGTRCHQIFLTQPEFGQIVLNRPPLSHLPELGLVIHSKRTVLVFTMMVTDVLLIATIFMPGIRSRLPWHCTLRESKITQVTSCS